MQKEIGKEYKSLSQREAFLKDNCDKVEEKGYMKQFTPEELQGHKESLANVSIQMDEIASEMKASAALFKAQLKPLTEQRRQMISNIKAKAEYVKEICFKFIDQDKKMVGYYNSDGDLIECRPANIDELQKTIFQMSRTGTDNE